MAALLSRWPTPQLVQGTAVAVAVSGDGTRALAGYQDGSLRLWDLERGHLLRQLEGHRAEIASVALSNAGERAITASHSGREKVLLWVTLKAAHASCSRERKAKSRGAC